MIFQNPWAWLGLLALALPIAAHLFARRPARRQLFPTLRFLPASRVMPVRRHRVTDAALLVVRCGILAAAVLALTQPWWPRAAATRNEGDRIARAIIVDASPSMSRATASGESARTAAARQADGLAASATTARRTEASTPVGQIEGAVAWLMPQTMRRELVIVSDFQAGTIGRSDLDRVPKDVGIRLVATAASGAIPPAAESDSAGVVLLAGPGEVEALSAVRRAVVARDGVTPVRRDRPVAIAFPQFDGRAALERNAKALDQPWMFEVASDVSRASAARVYADGLRWIVGDVNGSSRLVFLTNTAAGTLGSAALLAAVTDAVANRVPALELAVETIPDADLAAWSREPAPVGASDARDPDASDGRWFWLTAAALLAVETLMRRSRPAPDAGVSYARAA